MEGRRDGGQRVDSDVQRGGRTEELGDGQKGGEGTAERTDGVTD